MTFVRKIRTFNVDEIVSIHEPVKSKSRPITVETTVPFNCFFLVLKVNVVSLIHQDNIEENKTFSVVFIMTL